MIPESIADATEYTLMEFDYIANIKAQSRAGTELRKRQTLNLFRTIVDGKDTGWKVLFKN